jgi:hypothetical protein
MMMMMMMMMIVEQSVECELAGETEVSEKSCPTLSTINPTLPNTGSNRGRHGVKQATNRLSYGTATTSGVTASILVQIMIEFSAFSGRCYNQIPVTTRLCALCDVGEGELFPLTALIKY